MKNEKEYINPIIQRQLQQTQKAVELKSATKMVLVNQPDGTQRKITMQASANPKGIMEHLYGENYNRSGSGITYSITA